MKNLPQRTPEHPFPCLRELGEAGVGVNRAEVSGLGQLRLSPGSIVEMIIVLVRYDCVGPVIRPLEPSDIERYLVFAEKHAQENGVGATLRYGIRRPTDPWEGDRLRGFLAAGLRAEVGERNWVRVWIAEGATEIEGNASLRARPEPPSAHRALVGVGV